MPSLVAWCLAQTLAYPVTFPLLLRLLQQVESATENAWMRLLFGILCSCFVYAYTFFVSGIIFGCAMVLSQRQEHVIHHANEGKEDIEECIPFYSPSILPHYSNAHPKTLF